MEVIEERSYNQDSEQESILIVSQGSEFKNKIVDGIINNFEPDGYYLKIVDATTISETKASDWDAILIMHTMEIWQPQADVESFLNAQYDQNKMIVMATSASGEIQMEGIDGFTGASVLEKVDDRVLQFSKLIQSIIEN